ncbi:MAG: SDR family NAD(P)-dependent oxidoreductase [Phormidesmis sp.]
MNTASRQTPLQTALVTGASSGIGLAFVKLLARKGFDLILVARSEDKLLELKTEITEQYDIRAFVFSHDLTQSDAPKKIFEQVQQNNLSVHTLINNAGFGDYGEFATRDWSKQQSMIFLNVMALTHLSHLFLPGMIQRGAGGILNVASTAAFQPGPLMSVYFATKAYVLSLTEAIAAEVEGTGVNVSVLCPGPTQSNFAQVAAMGKAAEDSPLSDKLPSAHEVASYAYDALQKGQVVAVHGTVNKVLTFSNRLMPRSLIRKGVKQFMSALKSESDKSEGDQFKAG